MRRRAVIVWGCGLLLPAAAEAAEPQPRRRRRPARKEATATTAAAAARGEAPPIDPRPAPGRAGLDPAPVPGDPQPPASDRATRTSLDFGVPAPREPQQGQTFRSADPSAEGRAEAAQGGLRIPAPGATVRIPF